MPPTDILPLRGMDGTFEEGTVTGWWADDPIFSDVSWCRWQRSIEMAYEGNYSLKGYCRYRSTNLTLSNLTANTDYHFSLYVNVCGAADADGSDKYTRYDQFGIMGPAEKYLENATDVLVSRPALKGNMGWQRLDFYFNSGERTEVIFSAKLVAEDGGVVYYDNISLVQYEADEQLESTAFSVNEGKNNFQTVSVNPYNAYTVKFRAKGNGTVAAQKLLGQTLDIKQYVTSVSSVEVASDDFKEYSFNWFYQKYYNKQLTLNSLYYKDYDYEAITDFASKINTYYFDGNYKEISKLVKKNQDYVNIIKDKKKDKYIISIMEVNGKEKHTEILIKK